MTDSTLKDVPPSDPASEGSGTWRFFRKAFRWAYFGLLAIFLAGLLAIAFPLEGAIAGIAAVPVLIAQSSGILLVLMSAAWFALFSKSSWGTRGALAAAILLPLIVFAASIRDIDFTADMVAVPVFRWQKLQTQVVDEYRKQEAAAPSSGSDALPIPAITAEDMPGYRGAGRDGIITGPKLREDWTANLPKELWKRPVGEGYSQCVVAGNLLVTMEQRAEGESTVCYLADSGREAWIHTTPALFEEVQGGPGPRSTPQIDGDRVYALGATGELACLNLANGQVIWSKNVLASTGVQNAMWGMTSSPLIVDERLIVNIGGPIGNGLLSFDKMTGDLQWQTKGVTAKPGDKVVVAVAAPAAGASEDKHELVGQNTALAGYSSPMVAEINGVRQILNFDGTGLYGHDLANGQILWEYPFHNSAGVNVAQPIVLPDGSILISASYGLGTMRLRVTHEGDGAAAKWTVTPAWPKPLDSLKVKMASNILHDGNVYGLDEGIMVCIDPETGKRKWKGGRYGHGQFLLTNDRLVVLTDGGAVALVNASPKKHEELARFQAIPSDAKTWNPVALSRGILYVRNHRWMAAYDLCGGD